MHTTLPILAGMVSTTIFAGSVLPMLVKAVRSHDLSSYSLGNLALANAGNVVHSVYVFSLPAGPLWVLHSFYLLSTALMLGWYLRWGRRPPGVPGPQDVRSRRITSRGSLLATASVVPTTENPFRSNIDRVPTNAMVRSIRVSPGSTGWASTAGAPLAAAYATAPSMRWAVTPRLRKPDRTTTQTMLQTGTSSMGSMSFDCASRGISERGPMLHQPTGSPSR